MNRIEKVVYNSDMVQTISFRRGYSLELLFGKLVRIDDWAKGSLKAPFWRAYLPLEPGGRILYGDGEYPMEPGTLLIIPPETDFRGIVDAPFKKAFVHFSLRIDGYSYREGVYRAGLLPAEVSAWQACFSEARIGAPSDVFLPTATILRELHALSEAIFVPRDVDPRVSTILDWMCRHVRARASSAELASLVGLAPDYLTRLFHHAQGETPQESHRRLRLEEACRLLVSTPYSIKEIADRCGFSDRYHLTKHFRARWGIGPAAYRAREQGGR